MKNLKVFKLFILFILVFGCSTNDDSDNDNLSTNNSMTIVVDGVTYTFNSFIGIKTFDNIEVLGSNDNDENFYMRFNENGVIDNASFYSTDFENDFDFTSSYFWADGMFDLNNLSIDEGNMVVNADFNGTIYEDPFIIADGGSATINSGSFNIVYSVNENATVDVFLDANVNGQTYESVKTGQTGGFFVGTDIALTGYSDKEFDIAIAFNPSNTITGTYEFSTGNEIEKVLVSRYNPFTDEYQEYMTNGTLIIEEIVSGFTSYIRGTFELSANDGQGDDLNITNGEFFLVY
ncbi:hypothetical protein SAMN04515667_0846 [Formosa sp. Hel1_31_208]|uniref:DUF6252 family protein n=1 Tax=Formosa sp. Hel1_31_208 TaxID=1798225 RepID=UPI00087D3D30|nr:DUF6252 family protein [Formosa sp. Hel1_31_208]SDR85922.1 hypothetical protein SAMN04515667_0846 [Formosa sp. Hel1_31_208]